jgi:putative ABC transport system substrate-binding protein
MERRDFIILLGLAAAWSLAARAQETARPVIGFLHSGAPEQNTMRMAAWHKGLAAAGFVDGENLTIEYNWALGHADKLPAMAADLVRRQVALISTAGSTPATVIAKTATATIPIVFAIGSDPVDLGIVASLNRPGGNVTGVTSQNVDIAAKRLGVLRELVPHAAHYFAVVNPTSPLAKPFLQDLEAGGASLGVHIDTIRASSDGELEAAFTGLPQQADAALLFAPDSFFYIRRARIAALSARYAVPAIFDDREYVAAGALASYGADWMNVMEIAGNYTGRILKGERPADLPVVQAAKFEMAINLRTAKILGITVPPTLLALADEVIE